MPTVKTKIMRHGAVLPEYQSEGAAGADIRAFLMDIEENHPSASHIHRNGEHSAIKLLSGQTVIIPTGLAIELPPGHEMQVRTRSGLAKDGILVLNSPGTIDEDYRGEIGVILHNSGKGPFTLFHNTRIAQLVLAPVIRADFHPVFELSKTSRDDGGFGSTGRV